MALTTCDRLGKVERWNVLNVKVLNLTKTDFRKTRAYSKSQDMLNVSLNLYIAKHNQTKLIAYFECRAFFYLNYEY